MPEPTKDETWKTTTYAPKQTTFPFENLKVYADSEGNVKLDINGQDLTIPGAVRHLFLEKIQRAVSMADLADPNNEPLMKGMQESK